MQHIIAILSKEIIYARRLSDLINHRGLLSGTALAFDDIAALRSYGMRRRPSLIIADLSFSRLLHPELSLAVEDIEAARRVFLADSEAERTAAGPHAVLLKYQSAEAITRGVAALSPELGAAGKASVAGTDRRLVGIYSAIDRSSKTAFALALCREISLSERALYISLEEFSPVSGLLGQGGMGISEAVYLLRQGKLTKEKICDFIRSSSGIEWMPPVQDPADLGEIGPGDVTGLTALLGAYRCIVLDMDRWDGQAQSLLDICGTVYMPAPADPVAAMRQEELREYLMKEKGEEWMDKVSFVELPALDGIRAEAFSESLGYSLMGDFAGRIWHERS